MRLNHYIAQAGICSRRKAAELIKDGHVSVNNAIVTEPYYVVQSKDVVRYKKKVVKAESFTYILLNKPAGVITTTADEKGRISITDLIPKKVGRVFPVGRLDKDTTGLILLTNDGELAQKLAHPKFDVKKVYRATVDRPVLHKDMLAMRKGIRTRYGRLKADAVSWPNLKNRAIVQITLHSGKKRIIRRLLEHFDYKVRKLDRIGYAGLTKKGLKPGQWRTVNLDEIQR